MDIQKDFKKEITTKKEGVMMLEKWQPIIINPCWKARIHRVV
jgi:hypothetical protein